MPDNQSAVPVSQPVSDRARTRQALVSFSTDVEDTRVLRVRFDRKHDDRDRKAIIEALNAPDSDILAGQSVGDYVLREDAAQEVDFLTRIATHSPFWPNGCAAEIAKVAERIRSLAATPASDSPAIPEGMPIPMLLFCPMCGIQHIDEPDERTPEWDNPPHRSHLCHGCGCIWRPADVATVGVVRIETAGKADTWGESNSASLAKPTPASHTASDRGGKQGDAVSLLREVFNLPKVLPRLPDDLYDRIDELLNKDTGDVQ